MSQSGKVSFNEAAAKVGERYGRQNVRKYGEESAVRSLIQAAINRLFIKRRALEFERSDLRRQRGILQAELQTAKTAKPTDKHHGEALAKVRQDIERDLAALPVEDLDLEPLSRSWKATPSEILAELAEMGAVNLSAVVCPLCGRDETGHGSPGYQDNMQNRMPLDC
jgi:hypothetical protein